MLRVFWAGRTRDAHLASLADGYLERLRHYVPLRLEEIPAGHGGRRGHATEEEGERFLARLPARAHVVAVDQEGRERTSEELARWLERLLASGPGEIAFILGGHEGLAPAVRERAQEMLSLSKMTLTHEMARVVFLEQLYRAFTILRGESYHR